MATYKVLQDIEAEDKLVGPLTLKQFVYAGIAAMLLFFGWFIGRSSDAPWVVLLFLFPASPFLFLAAPLGRDQPNDIWLAARLRFFFKPRIRMWNQSGIQELVTVTAPKREEHIYTDGLSRGEVDSRLKLLASTIDSRGWATKNINLDLNNPASGKVGDRLVSPSDMPTQVSELDIKPWDDVLDGNNSAVGQHFQELMNVQTQNIRAEAVAHMQSPAASSSSAGTTSPMSSPASGIIHPTNPSTVAKPTVADEQEFLDKLHAKQEKLGIRDNPSKPTIIKEHAKAPNPASSDPQIAVADFGQPQATEPEQKESTTKVDPAIIKQFSENDDFTVATLAAQAKRVEKTNDDSLHDNDVIELH